jgi:hypothetical protein
MLKKPLSTAARATFAASLSHPQAFRLSADLCVFYQNPYRCPISTYVNYDGQLGREHYDSNAVTGGVRISF